MKKKAKRKARVVRVPLRNVLAALAEIEHWVRAVRKALSTLSPETVVKLDDPPRRPPPKISGGCPPPD